MNNIKSLIFTTGGLLANRAMVKSVISTFWLAEHN